MKGKIYFGAGAVQHIYQKTAGGFLIFYSVRDYLVFYTIFSCVARIHKVRVIGLCQMVDHLHVLVQTDDLEELRRFVHHYTTWFSQFYNKQHHQRGSLFSRPFGFASKTTSKEIRSAIAYLFNNPVERKQCVRPEQARWNYLAYGASSNPFSVSIKLVKASRSLRAALKTVKQLRLLNTPLSYTLLMRLFGKLSKDEQQQFIDYIISTYNSIDHAAASKYFDGYQNMVTAVNTTKGSEYEMQEEFAGVSDNVYNKISQYLMEQKIIGNVDDLLLLDIDSRNGLKLPLAYYTGATQRQLAKYLHLPE
ncbi:MAG: transposase [Bacteroidales bacterium]|nr:transposase [Bacteroidales bacterium]